MMAMGTSKLAGARAFAGDAPCHSEGTRRASTTLYAL
jgi:hypothetical protein